MNEKKIRKGEINWSEIADALRYLEEHGHEFDPELLPELPTSYKEALAARRPEALTRALAVLEASRREQNG